MRNRNTRRGWFTRAALEAGTLPGEIVKTCGSACHAA